ncbi:MAG TPA: type II toxin-antitoxin system RelE/ParE family toxin [Dysgonamonadaceae bacterium]|nr:type II toxin-antitoxin system RelE/ParE family toxin [Dysgonamonadaceae bacterium]
MAQRKIIWTKTADIQFAGILQFWLERNKSNIYSKKLIRLVTDRTKQIAKTPYMFKYTDFEDVRVASLGNFSIYYKITKEFIIITAFWDNRQDPKKLLDILK